MDPLTTKTHVPKITSGFDKGKAATGRSAFWYALDRRKKYFPTAEVRDAAMRTQTSLQEYGVGTIRTTMREEVELREMIRLRQQRQSHSLLEIFRAGLATLPEEDHRVAEAAAEFRVYKNAQVAAGELKENSRKQQLQAVNTLLKRFAHAKVSDLKNPEFEQWLMTLPHSPAGRWSYCKALGVFLNWLVEKKRWLPASPLKQLDIPQPKPKRIAFDFKQARLVLAVGVVEFPELTTLLGVEWFGTVRPETAELLDYSDFIRSENAIRLRVGKHAQGDVEFVEEFHPNLWKWIPNRKKGPIAPDNLKHRLTAFHARLGFSKKKPWPQDVARRTAISHLISLTGSLERGAKVALHSRPATTLRHYRRRFPKQESQAYYALTPGNLTVWYKKNRRILPGLIASSFRTDSPH